MEQQQSYFLWAVSETDRKAEQWAVELLVGSSRLEFKIDTGTDVTVICDTPYYSITHIPPDSPGGEIQCLGQIRALSPIQAGPTHSQHILHMDIQ